MRCLMLAAAWLLAAGPALAASPQVRCISKAGEATGITRGFAEYEALLIIRQVTGNWPIETDRIVNPVYSCRQGSVLWTCLARAQVCKR